jgi:hypothetical protein
VQAFYEFDADVPLFAPHLIVKERAIMEALTIGLPLDAQRITPLEFTRLISVWNALFQTRDLIFLDLFREMGEMVVGRMMFERITPKIKDNFDYFLTEFKQCHMAWEGGSKRWQNFKLFAAKKTKSKKAVLSIVQSL